MAFGILAEDLCVPGCVLLLNRPVRGQYWGPELLGFGVTLSLCLQGHHTRSLEVAFGLFSEDLGVPWSILLFNRR